MRSRTWSQWGYWGAAVLGLALLVWANYYLRATLETSGEYMYNFYRYFYPAAEKEIFGPGFPWWRRLLPFSQMTGSWSPTILVLTHYVTDWIGPARAWFVFNALVIVVSFTLSWTVFRSRVFSFTLAICLGFGTHLYYVYPNSGLIGFPLLFCYFLALLLCVLRVVTSETHRTPWKLGFAVALAVTALAYETWLDFLVFVWLASSAIGLLLWKYNERVRLRRLAGVVAVMTIVGLVYVFIKVTWGYGQSQGMESDLVFNYPSVWLAVEDVISNLFLNLYMALTAFLPPMFVSSTGFYELGGDRLVELQHGYHAPFGYLVPMQAMFLWRYFAGVYITLFALGLGYIAVAAWRSPTMYRVAGLVFMIMIATGGPTHAFIKARPLNSMAAQTYHVLTPVLGVSLLIALMAMLAWQRWPRWPRRWKGVVVVGGIWAVIFYGALARPGMISHQAAQSGLGVQVYPNPLIRLKINLGIPFSLPGGLHLYQLERHRPPGAAIAPTSEPGPTPLAPGPVLARLPSQAPALEDWHAATDVQVETTPEAWIITGDDTPGGYQLVSPAIDVPAEQHLLVRFRGTQNAGRVCLGILNADQSAWLLPPEPGRAELSVDTGANRQVWFVFTNCMTGMRLERSRFTVESVTYGIVQGPATEAP